MNLSNEHSFYRSLVGICLIAGPLVGLAEVVISPGLDTVADMAAHPGRSLAANLVGLLNVTLLIPIVLGFVHLLRARGPISGRVGGGLALVGIVGFAALHGFTLARLQVMEAGSAGERALAALEQGSVGGTVVLLMFLIGLFAGFAVLTVSLWRTRVVPRRAVGLIVTFLVVDLVGNGAGSDFLVVLAHAVLAVGSIWIGLKVLGMQDAEWEGPGGAGREAPQPRPAAS